MTTASECTERAVREPPLERGGRLLRMEPLHHSGGSEQGPGCGALTRVAESVGSLEVEGGVGFVRLGNEATAGSGACAGVHEECNGNVRETSVHDDDYVNGNPGDSAPAGRDKHTHARTHSQPVHFLLIQSNPSAAIYR